MKLLDVFIGYLLGSKEAREWLGREIVKALKQGKDAKCQNTKE